MNFDKMSMPREASVKYPRNRVCIGKLPMGNFLDKIAPFFLSYLSPSTSLSLLARMVNFNRTSSPPAAAGQPSPIAPLSAPARPMAVPVGPLPPSATGRRWLRARAPEQASRWIAPVRLSGRPPRSARREFTRMDLDSTDASSRQGDGVAASCSHDRPGDELMRVDLGMGLA